jgi:hypothetical protein
VVPPGPITLEDLYHFIAIGPEIGVVRIQGRWLKRQLENSAEGSLDPNPANWTGGWLFAYSGLAVDLDPYQLARAAVRLPRNSTCTAPGRTSPPAETSARCSAFFR